MKDYSFMLRRRSRLCRKSGCISALKGYLGISGDLDCRASAQTAVAYPLHARYARTKITRTEDLRKCGFVVKMYLKVICVAARRGLTASCSHDWRPVARRKIANIQVAQA